MRKYIACNQCLLCSISSVFQCCMQNVYTNNYKKVWFVKRVIHNIT